MQKENLELQLREWQNCAIIFARALSLKVAEGEAIVVNLPNEDGQNPEQKLLVLRKDGSMHIEPTDRQDLKEGDQFKV